MGSAHDHRRIGEVFRSFDIDATMKGLGRVDETLAQMAAGA